LLSLIETIITIIFAIKKLKLANGHIFNVFKITNQFQSIFWYIWSKFLILLLKMVAKKALKGLNFIFVLPDQFKSFYTPSPIRGLGDKILEDFLLATLSRGHERGHPVIVDYGCAGNVKYVLK
jgi:hypothetical protein